MTAWTRYALERERKGEAPDPVITENMQHASAALPAPKDGFTATQDETLLDYLMDLQKEIGNHDNLQHAIHTLLNEWRTSPNRNLYDWTLQTIRATKGPEDRVLVLAAIGRFLEESVDRFSHELALRERWQQVKEKWRDEKKDGPLQGDSLQPVCAGIPAVQGGEG